MIKIFHTPLISKILRIALPAIAGLSAQILLSIVDAAFVGRLNNAEYALAAMGLSVLATWAVVSFFSSLATGAHILIARKYGNNDYSACSVILYNSIAIGVFLGIIVSALGMTTAHIWAQLMAKDHRVGQLAGDFIVYRFIGLPFFLITVSFRGFFFGIGHTRIFMISAVIVNLLNIVFNYILIFGKFGLPAMGVAGSGLGSSLATICDSAFYIIIASTPAYRKQYHFLKNLIFSKSIVKSIFKLSLPVSFQNVFILIGFCIFVAITGLISTKAQAATQAIISTLFMSFLPCFGFGIAAQTLMGNAIGQGKNQLAKLYGYQTVTIALLFTLSIAILFLTIPQHILHVITEDHGIIDTAVPAMRIAGIAQIFYGIGIVLANSLQTLGKTSYVMFAEIITNLLILVPASYLFGVVLNWGLAGAWGAMPLYIVLYSIIVYIGYRKHNWNIKYND